MIEKGEVGQSIEQEEENAEMWNADAMGRLTMGAIITLKVSSLRFQNRLSVGNDDLTLIVENDRVVAEDMGYAVFIITICTSTGLAYMHLVLVQ